MNEFVTLAKRLADEAGKIVKRYYRQPFDVISKEDESPVTIADRKIEERMREILEDARPQDGIYGEEHGVKTGESGLTWVLDPIDGTKSFVIGRPTFGTLIALCEDSIPKLGVIDQPILGERWIGDGEQTFLMEGPFNVRLVPPSRLPGSAARPRRCLKQPARFIKISMKGGFSGAEIAINTD